MKHSFLAVMAAFFLSQGTTENTEAPSPSSTTEIVAAPTDDAPVLQKAEIPVTEPAAPVALPEVPEGMRVFVKSKGGRTTLTLVHRGHLVMVGQGTEKVLGENEVSLVVKASAPVTWETSPRKSFEVLQGEVLWAGTKEVRLRSTAVLHPMKEVSTLRHECTGFEGARATVTVYCRIDSFASGAARVFGDKPQDRIQTLFTDERKFFRLELDPGQDGADAVVLGYADGTRGHVLRAEVSVLPGETKPSFALLAASRTQPAPVFRIRHPIRNPHLDFFF